MAHSSLPIYLDPPNWQQQSNQAPTANDHQDPRQLSPFLPPPPSQPAHGSGVTGSIRPGSMAYRARLAMIPQPEAALKCPRCDSTNTKFCYFNNYSLSQPRHFCKTCRRYWTRGGALRNVPVGGGFRKNKKKKKTNRSKSPSATDTEMGNPRSSGGAIISAGCNIDSSSTMGNFPSQPPEFPSLPSLQHHLSRFGAGNTGLNFTGIQLGNMSSGRELDQWRSQQPPFIVAGLEPPAAAYPLNIQTEVNFGSNSSAAVQYCHQLQNLTPFSRISQQQQQQLKNEEQNQNQEQGISNFLRPVMGSVSEANQFWGGDHHSSWTDLSALSSSSSSHLL